MIKAKEVFCVHCNNTHIEGLCINDYSLTRLSQSTIINSIDNDIADFVGRLLIYEESFNNVPAGKLRQIAIRISEFIQKERDKKNEKTT